MRRQLSVAPDPGCEIARTFERIGTRPQLSGRIPNGTAQADQVRLRRRCELTRSSQQRFRSVDERHRRRRVTTGRTLSRYCEWTGPDAPALEANICCTLDGDTAHCELANLRGYCRTGVRMWCSHGEVDSATGRVSCMQVFPDACDAGLCVQAPPEAPQAWDGVLCCGPGGCVPVEYGEAGDCDGDFFICEWGMSLPDGTVECLE